MLSRARKRALALVACLLLAATGFAEPLNPDIDAPTPELEAFDLAVDAPEAVPEAPERELTGPSFYAPLGETWTDLPALDNDALFADYVDRLFDPRSGDRQAVAGSVAGELTGLDAAIYRLLKPFVMEIAAGDRSGTVFSVPVSSLTQDTFEADDAETAAALATESFTFNLKRIFHALVQDCPYEIFWFNSSVGVKCDGYGVYCVGNDEGGYTANVTGDFNMSMYVAPGYAAGNFQTKASAIAAARQSAETARAVVAKYAKLGDLAKLKAYLQYISSQVSYDGEAASGSYDGAKGRDPWQMIWVFDGDPDTNVVCEGYAKAFQYLCDASTFTDDISCYLVTGLCRDSRKPAAEAHMWNVLSMPDGKSYLADLAISDDGTEANNDALFLGGWAGKDAAGWYWYNFYDVKIAYWYDELTRSMTGDLTQRLSDAHYDDGSAPEPTVPLEGCKITVAAQTYSGEALTPKLTVKLNGKALRAGVDYTVDYTNNVNVGTATATITGQGAYGGTVAAPFPIRPKPTELSSLKAGRQSVTVAWNKAEAPFTGYQIQYSQKKRLSGGKTVAVSRKATKKTISKLKKGKRYYFRVRTVCKVKGKAYYSTWSKVKSIVVK